MSRLVGRCSASSRAETPRRPSRACEDAQRLPGSAGRRKMSAADTTRRKTVMPSHAHRLAVFAGALLFAIAICAGPARAAGDPEPREAPPSPPPASTEKPDSKASQKKKHEK